MKLTTDDVLKWAIDDGFSTFGGRLVCTNAQITNIAIRAYAAGVKAERKRVAEWLDINLMSPREYSDKLLALGDDDD